MRYKSAHPRSMADEVFSQRIRGETTPKHYQYFRPDRLLTGEARKHGRCLSRSSIKGSSIYPSKIRHRTECQRLCNMERADCNTPVLILRQQQACISLLNRLRSACARRRRRRKLHHFWLSEQNNNCRLLGITLPTQRFTSLFILPPYQRHTLTARRCPTPCKALTCIRYLNTADFHMNAAAPGRTNRLPFQSTICANCISFRLRILETRRETATLRWDRSILPIRPMISGIGLPLSSMPVLTFRGIIARIRRTARCTRRAITILTLRMA